VPFAVTRDYDAPTATITVPARSGSPTITVQWSGDDGAGSGAATYDLEVSEDGGVTWTRLLTNTLQTSYQYPGQPAHTYDFPSTPPPAELVPSKVEGLRTGPFVWAMDEQYDQLEGMQDITLVGHSKGGNVVKIAPCVIPVSVPES
jgi:hypothetical protein